MPTIGNNQFPYPNTSDEPNIPGDLQKLALAVDTAMGGGNRLIDTLATLRAIPNTQLFKGMRATVTNDPNVGNNREYVYTGGAWIHQQPRVFQGSFVTKLTNSGDVNVLSASAVATILGHAWDSRNCSAFCMNADADTQTVKVIATDWNTGGLNARLASPITGSIRINWIIIDAG